MLDNPNFEVSAFNDFNFPVINRIFLEHNVSIIIFVRTDRSGNLDSALNIIIDPHILP